jgi:Tfp pilus assembly protein PilN
MIRINLLGTPKPKGKKSTSFAMPTMDFNVGSPLMQVAGVVIVAGLLNAGYWYQLDKDKRVIAEKMQRAEAQNRELAEIKVRYLDRQKQAESYKRRVDVIDQLRNNQTGPVSLLAMIGDTVNNTEAIWLNSMQDQGASVAIDGTALSSDAVANLITNLQKTGYFRNIEIKESYQDDNVKDMQAFQFTLTCEKAKS